MSVTTSRHPSAQADGSPDTEAGPGLVSLNPEDGLFLRAEHLTTIQDYARALSMAVGQAAGAGVVWGLDLRIDEEARQLVAAPGLAVNGQGRPLLSRVSVRADLPGQAAAQDPTTGYWVVRACYDDELGGRENRYGNLCDDGCGCDGGASIRPFRSEGIRLDVSAQSEAGLGEQDPERRRGWLASWCFEQERRLADPWLTRGTEAQVVGSRLDREWFRGPAEPTTGCVPLGVLLQVGDRFVVDTWTARRDLGAGHADSGWRWRLGMRPWNVFMAQVLQFQDQLAAFVPGLANPVVALREVVDSRSPLIESYLRQEADREEVRKLAYEWASAAEPFERFDATTSLYEKGFTELPPAGFVPGADSEAELERRLDALFDDRVAWRTCSTSADAVARAVDDAQHLDRIPLTRAKDLPQVDVLVPDRAPDLPALRTEYGWVAFVRRRAIECRVGVDEVEVYIVEVDSDEIRQIFAQGLRDWMYLQKWLGTQPQERLGTLRYPENTWRFPGGDLVTNLGDLDARVFAIFAVPRETSRGPLMALRGQLFAASFTHQAMHVVVGSMEGPDLPAPEALVLLVFTPDGEEEPEVDEDEAIVETSTPTPPPPPAPSSEPRVAVRRAAERAASKTTASKTTASKTTASKRATAKSAASKSAAAKKTATKGTMSRRTSKTASSAKKTTARKRSASTGESPA
jgi:hypothetical protein